MTPSEDIIRKIQKLFSLAQSPNEAEATLAMNRAQALLAQYNLDSAMVMGTVVAGGTVAPAPEKREKTRMNRSAQYEWQRMIWRVISEANFCFHSIIEVYEGKRGKAGGSKRPVKRHLILGRESNVIAVRMMGEYLEDTMERILPYPNHERLSRSALSWKAGCAQRLAERITEQADARRQESDAAAGGTALVLRDVYRSEYEANYDTKFGAGAHQWMLDESEEYKAGAPERERLKKEAAEKAEREWLEYLQSETPQQKKRREREEAREEIRAQRASDRYSRSYWRERDEQAAKIDKTAYRAGSSAGSSIGLGTQVSDAKIRDKSRMVD